ncbi:hypothetical protein CsSME_00020776 [Camellia sinensis var. sinensis]
MAGTSSHGGGFLGAGDDFDPMTLPPRTRPFMPERYRPAVHVLPRAVFRHFTSFDERAPANLLLREPEQHLSHEAREGGSRSVRGYGSTMARDWYAELPEGVRDLVDLAGRTLMAALVERWWDTTNSFHFSATGDMTMTPFDFVVLTGLDVGGWAIPYDEDMGEWEAAWMYLLGARPPVDRVSGRVRYTWFSSHFRRAEMVPETPEETEQYARAPELEVVGIPVTPYSLIFEGPHRARPRETLVRLRQLLGSLGHPWVMISYSSIPERQASPGIGSCSKGQLAESGSWGSAFCASMRTADRLSYSEVVGAMLGSDALLYVAEGDYATYRHIYLMPPLTEARIPMMRPAGMSSSDQARARATDIPSSSRAGISRGGSRPAPPAPSIHPHVGWPDMPTELMAWQYGASSPIPIPLEPLMPSDRYAIDPDSPPPSRGYMEEVVGLVATLEGMVLRREAQLSVAGIQPSRGYMEEVVGLVATLEGMVLRREAQLSVAGIQMPTWSGQPQARPPRPHWGAGPSGPYQGAGPSGPYQGEGSSRPSRGAGPSRPYRGARGGPVRRRRAHVVEVEPDEEEEEEEEEATDRQFETSIEEGGSGFGSGNRGEAEEDPEDDSSDSDDGVEVVPQKRTRRASRSRSRGF